MKYALRTLLAVLAGTAVAIALLVAV